MGWSQPPTSQGRELPIPAKLISILWMESLTAPPHVHGFPGFADQGSLGRGTSNDYLLAPPLGTKAVSALTPSDMGCGGSAHLNRKRLPAEAHGIEWDAG